ncbi:hypothetical protein HMPREF9083_0699 [Dialister micraerophilus DSM 19965]|uniref:DUF721 domain-containing protein n=2 Tax=Dialister micraerophilus TaxID=309120 RepID=F2BWY1_9FIRM|nr:hypothetical protein HMPREF9083_0699 [Dialister micraerophilus DSM 19965]
MKHKGGFMDRKLVEVSKIFETSLLDSLFKNNENYKLFILQKSWENIAGSLLAKESFVLKFVNSVLFIQVTNSVWKNQLHMLKKDLLSKINALPYNFNFTDLRFVVGSNFVKRKPFLSIDKVNKNNNLLKNIHSADLDEKEKNQILRWIDSHIKNDDLKEPFKDFMLGLFKIRKGELLSSYTPCFLCSALCPPSKKICVLCENVLERKKKHAIVIILKKKPHLNYNEVNEIFPCSFESFSDARNMLISRYKDKIFKNHDTVDEKKFLLSLLIHKPLQNISDFEVNNALKYIPRSKF